MAKIIHVTRQGGPEHLQTVDVEPEAPQAGEVRFAVDAFSLNRSDLLYMTGIHYTGLKLPSRIGSEASGIVDAIGEGVTRFKIGDRVSSIPFFSPAPERHGIQGEWATVPEAYLTHCPEGISPVEACSIWMQYLTAYFALNTEGQLAPGRSVLLTAAASSAGIGAIQTAKALGAQIMATTRSRHKEEFLKRQGAHHVIITQLGTDFSEEIKAQTDGKGVDLVFDPISGTFISDYINGLNWGGRIMIYGMLESTDMHISILPMVRKKAILMPYSMFNYVSDPRQLEQAVGYVTERITCGDFRPVIDKVFPFDHTKDAYAHMLGNQQIGKIVVAVSASAQKYITH